MEHVLHRMHDHRPAAFLDRDKTFDAQKVGTAQCRQHSHCLFESRPGQRPVEDQREAAEPVSMFGPAEVEPLARRRRLGEQEGRLDFTSDGDSDRRGVQRTKLLY